MTKTVEQPMIGQTFMYNRHLYECVKDPNANCDKCAFSNLKVCLRYECRAEYRDDMENVKFKKLNIKDYNKCEVSYTDGINIVKETQYIKKSTGVFAY